MWEVRLAERLKWGEKFGRSSWKQSGGRERVGNPDTCIPLCPQNIMPLSAAMFLSERKNPTPQCPPRLEVQMLMPVSWSRMPNHFLQVDTRRAGERLGWAVQCQEPLTMMALHIPEENRSGTAPAPRGGADTASALGSGSHPVPLPTTPGLQTTPQEAPDLPYHPQITLQGALNPFQQAQTHLRGPRLSPGIPS